MQDFPDLDWIFSRYKHHWQGSAWIPEFGPQAVISHLSIKESLQLISISMSDHFFLQVILRSACLSEDVFHVPWTCHLVFGEEFQVRMWPRWEQTRTSVSKQCSLLHHHWLQLASCVQFPLVTFSGRIPNINVMIHHGLVWGLGFGNHFTVATSKL